MKTWQAILSTMRYRPWTYFFNIMAMVVFFIAIQIPALAMREFFNLLSGSAPARVGFWGIVTVFLASGLGRSLGHYMMVTTHVPLMYSVAALLQKNLFAHILKQPAATALPDSPGEAISRFRGDVDTMRGFPMGIADLIGSLFSSIMALSIMLSINARVTLYAFLPIAIIYIIAQIASRRIEIYRRASREKAGQVTGFIGEVMGAVQAIKVAHGEKSVIAHFSHLNRERSQTALRDNLFNTVLRSVYNNAVNIGTGVIMIMVGRSIRDGSFTIGDLALFTYLLGFVTALPQNIGNTIGRYRQAGVSMERMQTLMQGAQQEDIVRHGPIYEKGDWPAIQHVPKLEEDRLQHLETRRLSYTYPDSNKGIADIDLVLERGSFTVVTGRIGSGKSTLVKALLGLLPRQGGQILWNGAPVEDPAAFFVPPRSAFTAQNPHLFSETLRDNLLMGLPAEKIDRLCATPNSWSSTICLAPSTWRPSKSCGSGSLTGARPPV